MSWYDRSLPLLGQVMFRGALPPQPGELRGLEPAGWTVETREAEPDEQWRRRIRHPRHGAAILTAPRGTSAVDDVLITWDPRLHEDEKERARLAGCTLHVQLEPPHADVLRERKRLLRVLGDVAAHDAVGVFDMLATAMWAPAALAEELAHDAPVDISALFTMHLLRDDAERVYWLHSHGLREVGFTDFDILEPAPSCWQEGFDGLRALAYAIVEEALVPGGAPMRLVSPGGDVKLVPAREIHAREDAPAAWRADTDDFHLDGHAVVCDGVPERRFFGLLKRPPRPAAFFQRPLPDHPLMQFSKSASELMAVRARETFGLFRAVREELAELGLPSLVKLGYPVDGDPGNAEHIWFEVHEASDDAVDATCLNRPYNVAALQEGQRGRHDLALLSDWTIFTPFGGVNPRFQTALRETRARPDEARRRVQEGRP